MDSSLSFRDEIGYRFHHVICHTCRQVAKHWKKMHAQLRAYGDEVTQSEELKLSEAKAEEIIGQFKT